jgi:hypothetical protein
MAISPPQWLEDGRTGPGALAPKLDMTDTEWRAHPAYRYYRDHQVTASEIGARDHRWLQQYKDSGGSPTDTFSRT